MKEILIYAAAIIVCTYGYSAYKTAEEQSSYRKCLQVMGNLQPNIAPQNIVKICKDSNE